VTQTILAVGPARGGVGDVFRRALDGLTDAGYAVEIITPDAPRRIAWDVLRHAWRWRRSLRRADIVHVEFGSNDVGVFWFLVAVLLVRRDCVVVAHDYPQSIRHPGAWLLPTGRRRLSAIAYRLVSPIVDPLLMRWLRRRSGVLAVFSEAACDGWRRRGVPRVQLIHLGGNPPRERSRAPSEGVCVLFAGFLGPGKGVDTLLEAWRTVGREVELPLVIAGDAAPPYDVWLGELRSQAAAMPNPPRFVGGIPDEDDFDALIASAAIVVMPYRTSSPASGILVRSMWSGRPVIITAVPAARAIVSGTDGVVVGVDDPPALAEAIRSLSSDPALRDRLGSQARATAARRFGWARHLADLRAAYAMAVGPDEDRSGRANGRGSA
jgi:glycosyltransferase involved in cell wall biosynthesis